MLATPEIDILSSEPVTSETVTNSIQSDNADPSFANVSSSNIKLNEKTDNFINNNCDFGFDYSILFNISVLVKMPSDVGKCPSCIRNFQVEYLLKRKTGVAKFFELKCYDCSWKKVY